MEPPLLRIIVLRLLLAALPFAVWFAWAWQARRSGRPMGSTPWPWLVAAAGALVALSLLGTVVFHADNRTEHYVPGEPRPDGSVTKGHFEKPQS
jgi:drug/metabolite transporter (DMT)-like permease